MGPVNGASRTRITAKDRVSEETEPLGSQQGKGQLCGSLEALAVVKTADNTAWHDHMDLLFQVSECKEGLCHGFSEESTKEGVLVSFPLLW